MNDSWFNNRLGATILALGLLLAAYAMSSVAFRQGGALAYIVTFLLAGIAVNRVVHAFKLILLQKGRNK